MVVGARAYSPDELIEFQKNVDNSSQYEIFDLIQRWIFSMDNHRASYKKRSYATIKSFFLHNRAPLPKDLTFKISGDKPKTRGRLNVDIIKNVILASNRTYRAIFLSMLQGGLGLGEFEEWNETGLQSLLKQLRSDSDIVKIELSGRKHQRYKRNFYTFIGRDAINEIRKYLKLHPRKQGSIFLNQFGKPVSKYAVRTYWRKKIYSLGYAFPSEGTNYRGHRTGMNIHELRDIFRSQWELSPAKSAAAEYFLGHRIDDLEYNKIFDINEKFARQEYRKAVDYLNLISSDRPYGKIDEDEVFAQKKEVEAQRQRIKELEEEIQSLKDEVNSAYEVSGQNMVSAVVSQREVQVMRGVVFEMASMIGLKIEQIQQLEEKFQNINSVKVENSRSNSV